MSAATCEKCCGENNARTLSRNHIRLRPEGAAVDFYVIDSKIKQHGQEPENDETGGDNFVLHWGKVFLGKQNLSSTVKT
jgi:hypothetical protein